MEGCDGVYYQTLLLCGTYALKAPILSEFSRFVVSLAVSPIRPPLRAHGSVA